ncbi:MAG: DUF4190 domain-containing protein [Clostridiales bacterium]|nr:DUF4190 domain-containing protein [Clostridiales bacterium]
MQDQNWNYNSNGNQNGNQFGVPNGNQYGNQPQNQYQPQNSQPYGQGYPGQPSNQYYNNGYNYNQKRESTGICVASMVLGLIGIIAWILPLVGYPVLITGLVLGIKGLERKAGKGMAVAGIVLCCVFLVFTLINSIAGAMKAVNGSIGGGHSAGFTSIQQMVYLLSVYL